MDILKEKSAKKEVKMRGEKSSVFICKNAVSPCVLRVSRNFLLRLGGLGLVGFFVYCILS